MHVTCVIKRLELNSNLTTTGDIYTKASNRTYVTIVMPVSGGKVPLTATLVQFMKASGYTHVTSVMQRLEGNITLTTTGGVCMNA